MARTYRTLTPTEATRARTLLSEGHGQKVIARDLHIAKQSVANFFQYEQIGKRRPPEASFWSEVKGWQMAEGLTWKQARKKTFLKPKWARKRAKKEGKVVKSWNDYWDHAKSMMEDERTAYHDEFWDGDVMESSD